MPSPRGLACESPAPLGAVHRDLSPAPWPGSRLQLRSARSARGGAGAAKHPRQGRGLHRRPSQHKPPQLSLKSKSLGLRTRADSYFAAQPWSRMCDAHWPVGILCIMQSVCICSFSPCQPKTCPDPTATPLAQGRKLSHCCFLSGRVQGTKHSLWWKITIHPLPHPILQRQCLWHCCRVEAELKSSEVLDFYSMVPVIQNEGS